ncbi:MAG: hypothetical protein JO356_09715 [Acidobacteria bacterium]|nr:hypothetical protein [Acidobacteriota bacterium]
MTPWIFAYTAAVQSLRVLFLGFLLTVSASAEKNPVSTLRWTEGAANCTLRAGDDGHIYYGLSSLDFDVTVSVDRQELEKIPFRIVPMLSVELSFHLKRSKELEIAQNKFTLEFVKHFHVVENALDPGEMLKDIRTNMDDLTDEVEHHELKKHPDQKQQKEAQLQARLKEYTQMSDFIGAQGMRPLVLTSAKSEASGWIFFNIKNRWIGPWRKPEEFILRLPIEEVRVEFPFQLPPKGRITLMHRPGKS